MTDFHAPPFQYPAAGATGSLLASVLDSVDYGLLLLHSDGGIVHANRKAAALLQDGQVLRRSGGRVVAGAAADMTEFHAALQAAADKGLRRLLSIGPGAAPLPVALVPVQPGVALLMLARDHLCEALSIQGFARAHALTAAETRVLEALGRGVRPQAIAKAQGVTITTVRTQLGAIRGKLGVQSIFDIVHRIAALPPIVARVQA